MPIFLQILTLLMCLSAVVRGQNTGFDLAETDIRHLKIAISVDPANRYLAGSTSLFFVIPQKEHEHLPIEIQLSDDYIISSISSNGKNLPYYRHTGHIRIYPNGQWGQSDSVTVAYYGIPPSSGMGSVVFDKHENVPVFWTLSEPYGAMDWFPCKQDVADKVDSTFIIVTCPAKYRAAANGRLYADTVMDGTRRMEWRHMYPISYYLIGVAVTNYRVYSDWMLLPGGDSLEITNYVYPERYDQWKRRTARLLPAFRMMCDSFGPYPFRAEKYGHAQFGWNGGIEHQTMTFIKSPDLDLMIHELAHHWFGDMITCRSWDDVFLNEGFATYCEMLATEKGLASSSDPIQWRKVMAGLACKLPDKTLHISNVGNASQIFDYNLVYAKGAMVLHALRKELGDATFFRCLKSYVSNPRLKYSSAGVRDFFDAVKIISGKNLDWFLQQWYYGAGFPVYNIRWQQNYDGLIDIIISQSTTDSSVQFFRSKVSLMLCGINGERKLYVLNNYYNNQHITINPHIDVSNILLDPYCDLITAGGSVENEKLMRNDVMVKTESSGNIKVTLPDDVRFDWYIIRNANTSQIAQRASIKGSHRFEIHTAALTEGSYILILEGSDYYSTKVYLSKRRKRRNMG